MTEWYVQRNPVRRELTLRKGSCRGSGQGDFPEKKEKEKVNILFYLPIKNLSYMWIKNKILIPVVLREF
jgi:hypothetical protein